MNGLENAVHVTRELCQLKLKVSCTIALPEVIQVSTICMLSKTTKGKRPFQRCIIQHLERGKGARTCISIVHPVERDGVVPALFQGLEKECVGLSRKQETNLVEGRMASLDYGGWRNLTDEITRLPESKFYDAYHQKRTLQTPFLAQFGYHGLLR